MSGVTITYKITELFGASADPTTITLPVPNVSPGVGNPNRASFDTAFPAICFSAITSGGQPPSGKDFNGLFYMLSQYALAMQAGQAIVPYDAGTQATLGGYPLNALLANAAGNGFWLSTVANNMTDPDTGGAGWAVFPPTPTGLVATAITAGAHNDYSPVGFGPTVGFLDLSPAADANITGIAAGGDGQQLIVTNLSAHNLTLNSLNGGSMAQNQLRIVADLTLGTNNSARFVYSVALALWVNA